MSKLPKIANNWKNCEEKTWSLIITFSLSAEQESHGKVWGPGLRRGRNVPEFWEAENPEFWDAERHPLIYFSLLFRSEAEIFALIHFWLFIKSWHWTLQVLNYFTIGIAAGSRLEEAQMFCNWKSHILEISTIKQHPFFKKKLLTLPKSCAPFAPILGVLLIVKRFWCSHCLMSTVQPQIQFLPDRFTWLIRSITRVNKCCNNVCIT